MWRCRHAYASSAVAAGAAALGPAMWESRRWLLTGKVTGFIADVLSKRAEESATRMFQDVDKFVTEPRRKYQPQRVMTESLAERVATQRQDADRFVPVAINVSKDKQYVEFSWPSAVLDADTPKPVKASVEKEDAHVNGSTTDASGAKVSPSNAAPAHVRMTPYGIVRTRILAEYLRAMSPSTDVMGSGILVYGRRGLEISDIVPMGNYALRFVFSDGHDGGIYPYPYLYQLSAEGKFAGMRRYILQLKAKRKSRDPPKRRASTAIRPRLERHK